MPMGENYGRVGSAETGSRASTTPANAVDGPTGFDPARGVYLKRPLAIEAWQFNSDRHSYDLLNWVNNIQYAAGRPFARWINDQFLIPTLEGEMSASKGDWVIRGIGGEFYPCKPGIFASSYDQIGPWPALATEAGTASDREAGMAEGEGAGLEEATPNSDPSQGANQS